MLDNFTRREFETFVSLSDVPDVFARERWREYEFGEERDWPLSRAQMLFLKMRYGVYFPWQIFYELIPTDNWEDKSNGRGKTFTDARLMGAIRRLVGARVDPRLGWCGPGAHVFPARRGKVQGHCMKSWIISIT